MNILTIIIYSIRQYLDCFFTYGFNDAKYLNKNRETSSCPHVFSQFSSGNSNFYSFGSRVDYKQFFHSILGYTNYTDRFL